VASLDETASRTPWALFGASWVVAMGVAVVARGRVHPDEIFQALEPAHRLAFGTGEVAWEWVAGLRNWLVPGLLAWPLRLGGALGLRDPRLLVLPLWALCAAWQASGTLFLFRYVEERDGRGAAWLAGLLHATWGGFAIYAARTIGDALAIPALLASLCFTARALRRDVSGDALSAGAALGLAILLRYPSLVFALPLGGAIFWRRPRALPGFVVGLALLIGALAVLDRATWGEAFFSLRHYLAFNRPGGGAVRGYGAEPWWWYGGIFAGMAPLPLLYPFAQSLRRPGLAHACFFSYLAAVELHPHKEPRFLLPLLPLLTLCSAGEAIRDLERWRVRRPALRWLGPIYAAWSLAAASVLLPFALDRNIVDAEIAAGRDPSLTGLLVADDFWATGGRFYLHRDVPIRYGKVQAALRDRAFSHLLFPSGPSIPDPALAAAGWSRWWRRGACEVWKRR